MTEIKRFKTWDDLTNYMFDNMISIDDPRWKYCPEYITRLLSYGSGGGCQGVSFDDQLGWMIVWQGQGMCGIDYIDKGYRFVSQFVDNLDADKIEESSFLTPSELDNKHLRQGLKNMSSKLLNCQFLIDMIGSLKEGQSRKDMDDLNTIDGLTKYIQKQDKYNKYIQTEYETMMRLCNYYLGLNENDYPSNI